MSCHGQIDKSCFIATLVLISTAISYYLYAVSPVPLQKPLASFPQIVGAWRGGEIPPDPESPRIKGADEELLRTYQDTTNRTVTLYIAYFQSQNQKKKLVNYASKDLHRGVHEVQVANGSSVPSRINHVIISKAGKRWTTLHWYDLNGRIVTGRSTARIHTLLNALLRGRNNGALVLVSQELGSHDDPAAVRAVQEAFVQSLMLILRSYLP